MKVFHFCKQFTDIKRLNTQLNQYTNNIKLITFDFLLKKMYQNFRLCFILQHTKPEIRRYNFPHNLFNIIFKILT